MESNMLLHWDTGRSLDGADDMGLTLGLMLTLRHYHDTNPNPHTHPTDPTSANESYVIDRVGLCIPSTYQPRFFRHLSCLCYYMLLTPEPY